MDTFFFPAVIKNNVKTAGHCDEKLMAALQGVPRTVRTTRYVVEVKDALDLKWDMIIAFYEGQVAPWIGDFGKVDDLAILKAHGVFS